MTIQQELASLKSTMIRECFKKYNMNGNFLECCEIQVRNYKSEQLSDTRKFLFQVRRDLINTILNSHNPEVKK